jgi:hypothetical protein
VKHKVCTVKAGLQNPTTWKFMIIAYKINYICWPTKSTTDMYSNGTSRSGLKTTTHLITQDSKHFYSEQKQQFTKDSL